MKKDSRENNRQPSLVRPSAGLHMDSSPENQPEGTYRFALNSTIKSSEGDIRTLSTENSNKLFSNLPHNHIYLGSCYMSKERFAIFSLSSSTKASEIGIFNSSSGRYETYVNDYQLDKKFNFQITHQIDAIYRLRRGCDDVVYFVDHYNNNRYFNFSKPHLFKTDNRWDVEKFDLQKRVKKVPTVGELFVEDSNGSLPPGSYSAYLQYVDEDLNGTGFMPIFENINIYHDRLNSLYSDIEGSINLEQELLNYGNTSKSISVDLTNLDRSFIYYRLAFAHYTDNSGRPSKVYYTDVISTKSPFYTYSGNENFDTSSIEELKIALSITYVEKSKNIAQQDNMLLLSNLKGEDINYCKLQSFASKIAVDCYTKKVNLTDIKDIHNPKNPSFQNGNQWYMPGEIYSLGIVYIFEDGTESPSYHIPGKSSSSNNNTVFSQGEGVYPMSVDNNKNLSESYLANDSECSEYDYWGLDNLGNRLFGGNVRHHRFPTRKEIGIGFVEKTSTIGDNTLYKKIVVTAPEISGIVGPFTAIVRYKLNGASKSFEQYYENTSVGENAALQPSYFESDVFSSSGQITDLKLFIEIDGNEIEDEDFAQGGDGISNFQYQIVESTSKDKYGNYEATVLGLKLSNIDIPSEDVIGKNIVGYRIVRQERLKQDKTILDTGVILPTIKNKKYVSSSLLSPEWNSCEPDFEEFVNFCDRSSLHHVNLLTPRYKVLGETFDNFTRVEQEGSFNIVDRSYTGFSLQDVMEGSSATGDETPSTDDEDGFNLRHTVKNVEVEYRNSNEEYFIQNEDINIYDLNALEYAQTEQDNEILYNLSFDNKNLYLSKNTDETIAKKFKGEYPYVIIKRDFNNFYQNYRNRVYYDYNNKIFDSKQTEVICFGGDTNISPLRHTNHLFLNAVAAHRKKKANIFQIIAGAIIAVVGAVLSSVGVGVPLVTLGIALASAGGIFMVSMALASASAFNSAYTKEWEKGLKDTVFDKFLFFIFRSPFDDDFRQKPFADDTLRWHGDIISDFFFETDINLSLRVSPIQEDKNHLKPLKPIMDNNAKNISLLKERERRGGKTVFKSHTIDPETDEEYYFYNKLFSPDEQEDGMKYNGISIPILYLLNKDHNIYDRFKIYSALPLEYDCCSDCNEKFPHRWTWSEQSFQEEITDNYRTFLPNNYKDISGETGEIVDMFIFSNNLFLHTEEALYLQPKSYQERVTDQIVTFIGTGSYGELPERKVVDTNNGQSAGTKHKFGKVMTPFGVYFPCEKEKTVFYFNGQKLDPISRKGLERFFKNNLELTKNKDSKLQRNKEYEFLDNTSNPIGIGYAMGYDSYNDRILITKKDYSFKNEALNDPNNTYFFCEDNVILFLDYQQTIENRIQEGWTFEGYEDCKMRFSKKEIKTKEEEVQVGSTIPNDASVIILQDSTGSFDFIAQQNIKDSIVEWYNQFSQQNPDWNGDVSLVQDSTERPWRILSRLDVIERFDINGDLKTTPISNNIIVVNFTNEANSVYHPANLTEQIPPPTSHFIADYNSHIQSYNNLIQSGGSFRGLVYPISFQNSASWSEQTAAYLQHVLAALKGRTYTEEEIPILPILYSMEMSGGEEVRVDYTPDILASIRDSIPYPEGLENFGWKGIVNNFWVEDSDNPVVTPEQFQNDMNEFLQGEQIQETEIIEVQYEEEVFDYVEGIPVKSSNVNRSWTLSYSLETQSWISYHSYMPINYLQTSNELFTFYDNDNRIWKHNIPYHYRTFCEVEYPQIIEYVDNENPLSTKIWENLDFIIRAEKYDVNTQSVVEDRYKLFDKIVLYNRRQTTGELFVKVKDEEDFNYLSEQVTENDEIFANRDEINWTLNDFRDIRVNYDVPIWNEKVEDLQDDYFIDKKLNVESLDSDKDWYNLELLRDKYLVIRITFDKFANINYISEFYMSRLNSSER